MDSSLLSTLPPEIRNAIYFEVLVISEQSTTHIYGGVSSNTSSEDRWSSCYDPRAWNAPALLQVCQQIRNEASPIYYGMNSFRFMDDDGGHPEELHRALVAWLVLIGSKRRSYVRKIRLENTSYFIEEVDEQVSSCRALLAEKKVAVPEAEILVLLKQVLGAPDDWESDSCIYLSSSTRVSEVDFLVTEEDRRVFEAVYGEIGFWRAARRCDCIVKSC